MKQVLIKLLVVLSILTSVSAVALERTCYGRIYAQHLRTGYQIDIVNHITAKAHDINASAARYQAADNIWYCARDWWYARDLLAGANAVSALPPSCRNPANGSVDNLLPAHVDIKKRLKLLACGTFRSLVDISDFHVAIHVETRGDNYCGTSKKSQFLLDPIVVIAKEECAPRRTR